MVDAERVPLVNGLSQCSFEHCVLIVNQYSRYCILYSKDVVSRLGDAGIASVIDLEP